MASDPRSPSRFRRVIFALATALATLAMLEGVLRLPWVEARLAVPDPTFGIRPGAALLRRSGDRWVLAPGAHRSFNPVSIAVDRSEVDLRVVCLGGSSTFGYPYGEAISFCRFLEHRLQFLAAAGERIETVNLGGMSYGSHRVAGLVDTIAALEPDAVILYSGHNEFVEAEMVGRMLDGPRAAGSSSPLTSMHLVAWLDHGLRQLRPPAVDPVGGSADLFGFTVSRNEGRIFTLEEKARVAEVFETRMLGIVERFEARGIPVILSTLPSNLSGWKPDRLAFAYPLAPEDRHHFLTQLAGAMRLLELGRFTEAATALEEAESIDDRHALTAYLRGIADWERGDGRAARAHLARARDLDPIPIRATSAINDAIRRVAERTGAPLADAQALFTEASPDGVIGERLILDYCHPTAEGHRRIADALVAALGQLQAFRDFDVDRLSSFSAEHETSPNPAEGSANVLWWLGVVADRQDRTESARRYFELGLAREPEHVMLLRHLAQLDQREGRIEEARERFHLLATRPRASVSDRLALAALDLRAGSIPAAREALEELRDEEPRDARVWLTLGQLERRGGDARAGRAALEHAIALEPGLYAAYLELGATCRELEDRSCAIRAYRGALGLAHYSPSALAALGELEAD